MASIEKKHPKTNLLYLVMYYCLFRPILWGSKNSTEDVFNHFDSHTTYWQKFPNKIFNPPIGVNISGSVEKKINRQADEIMSSWYVIKNDLAIGLKPLVKALVFLSRFSAKKKELSSSGNVDDHIYEM